MLAPIDGYPKYLVSDYGEIISMKTGKALQPYRVGAGYQRVDLRHKGKRRQVAVHQLVAEHFVAKSDGETQINHIDGNKLNNHYSNLEWCTPKENMKHAKQNGLLSGKPVTIEMISLKDGSSKIFPSITALARKLNKSSDTVRYILAGSLRGPAEFTIERMTEKKSPEGPQISQEVYRAAEEPTRLEKRLQQVNEFLMDHNVFLEDNFERIVSIEYYKKEDVLIAESKHIGGRS